MTPRQAVPQGLSLAPRLTIGSLFSGIGGLELGLERAGLGPVIWQAESDPFARKVLAKHWPGVKVYEDVREIDERAERPGIICGGFPCQDISNAGHRAGLAGERSGLWREFARIVGVLRPRFVVVENVAALLERGMGDVLGDLAALGLDAEWSVLPACALDFPHTRERVFILAYAAAQRPIKSAESLQESRLSRESRRVSRGEGLFRLDQSPVVGSRDGIPDYFHRNESLGNAVVPQVAEWIGRRILEASQ